jgi:hypothetical protein
MTQKQLEYKGHLDGLTGCIRNKLRDTGLIEIFNDLH